MAAWRANDGRTRGLNEPRNFCSQAGVCVELYSAREREMDTKVVNQNPNEVMHPSPFMHEMKPAFGAHLSCGSSYPSRMIEPRVHVQYHPLDLPVSAALGVRVEHIG